MIIQVSCVGLLCGLLIHQGRDNTAVPDHIRKVSLEVLAILMPAVIGAGFIFVYDEVRRPLKEMASLKYHKDLTIRSWCGCFGYIKLWEILFGLLSSWAYFISLVFSTRNTLRNAQGFTNLILNLLAYVFVFGVDDWTYSMIAVSEFVPQWSDESFVIDITEKKEPYFSLARHLIKISMFTVYLIVLALWFYEFVTSK